MTSIRERAERLGCQECGPEHIDAIESFAREIRRAAFQEVIDAIPFQNYPSSEYEKNLIGYLKTHALAAKESEE